ncbi:MAG: phosphoribosylformylglycinamidine synthase subunit PurQ [bacterium]|nr:phosphoribosylformylglycinamidine synthase subunit PurQ [bacterium]
MKWGVIVFPGSNCDHDCYWVLKHSFNQEVEYIWHKETNLAGYDCLILPGGFSYGDYLRTGAIARFSRVMLEVEKFANRGGIILGICNGFQILLEAGFLPGAMLRNKNLNFICKYVTIRVENEQPPFTNLTSKGRILNMPIAHMDGNYYADKATLEELNRNNQVIFRYSTKDGRCPVDANPNGSLDNIAGICNREGNILGMMPHPERCIEKQLGSEDGRVIFESIMASV